MTILPDDIFYRWIKKKNCYPKRTKASPYPANPLSAIAISPILQKISVHLRVSVACIQQIADCMQNRAPHKIQISIILVA